jgi:hypothetical protein
MLPRITDDLMRAMEDQGGAPLYLEDSASNRYVLVRAEEFEKLRPLLQADEIDPREMYALIDEVMKEDWDDPAMDVYDDYDAHRARQ